MDSQSLDRMDSQLLDRSDEARDLAETALYTNRRREYDGYAFVTQPFSFPWGSQWLWGFESTQQDGAAAFRVHNTHLMMGTKLFRNVVNDGSSPGESYVTVLVPTEVPEEEQGEGFDPSAAIEWGIAVDIEWTSLAQYDPEITNLVDAAAVIVWDEVAMVTPAEAGTTETAPGRIPVAWFSGMVLQRDYIHGIFVPQIWV